MRRQTVGERQVLLGPISHRHGAAVGDHEAVVAPVGVLDVGLRPFLARLCAELTGGGHPKCALLSAVSVGVARRRIGVAADHEAVAAGPVTGLTSEHPEEVVVGVVLHHEHDDMLDLGQRVGAGGQLRVGEGVGQPHGRAPERAKRVDLRRAGSASPRLTLARRGVFASSLPSVLAATTPEASITNLRRVKPPCAWSSGLRSWVDRGSSLFIRSSATGGRAAS